MMIPQMDIVLSVFGPTTHGESPEQIVGNLCKTGVNQLLFFTSHYHGYRLLQSRYPGKAIYTLETDRIFYEPDLSFYKDSSIKPERSQDFPDVDSIEVMSKACHAEGIKFSPLVPICAAERLVQSRPDLAVRNLYGSPDRMFLCYNNPQVQMYRFAMVREIIERYEIDNLVLDKIPQTLLEPYSFSGIFDPPLRTVGSLCFCEHCKTRANTYGLDLDEVQIRVREIANRSLRIPQYIHEAAGNKLTGDSEIPLLLLEEPLIYEALQFRFATSVELVGKIREIVKQSRPSVGLHAAFVPPSHVGHDKTSPHAWLAVQSYKKYAEVLDKIYCVIHYTPDVVRLETEKAVSAACGKIKVISSMRLYGPTRPEEVALLAEAALAGGSDGVSFLGYDVTSNELLQALGRWVKTKGALIRSRS